MSILYKLFNLRYSVITAQKGLTRMSGAVMNKAGSLREQMSSASGVRILFATGQKHCASQGDWVWMDALGGWTQNERRERVVQCTHNG